MTVYAEMINIRDGVHKMRSPALAVVPIRQDILQAARPSGDHAPFVRLNRHNLNTSRPGLAQDVRVHKDLAQQSGPITNVTGLGTPRVDKGVQSLGKAVRGAYGQDDVGAVLVGHIRVQGFPCKLPEEREQGWVTLCGAILQGGLNVDLLYGVGVRGQGIGQGDVRRGLAVGATVAGGITASVEGERRRLRGDVIATGLYLGLVG